MKEKEEPGSYRHFITERLDKEREKLLSLNKEKMIKDLVKEKKEMDINLK